VYRLEGKQLAASRDVKFIETSSGIQHNVDELLVGILKQVRVDVVVENCDVPSFPFLSSTKDSSERESREEAIVVENEELTNPHITAYGQRDSAEDLLQPIGYHKVEKL